MAGNLSIETLGSIWQKPDRRGSSHYGINGNKVGQYVKESDIAWTDGNWESNRRSVTIETANSTGDPTWEIAGATYQTLIKLVADIARRNNFGTLIKGQNVTWHSMYSATQCPGPDLLRLMDSIVSEANRINAETPVGPEPPVPSSPTYEYGAVRHPETGEVYPIMIYQNFKEYIEPKYELVYEKEYINSEFNLAKLLSALEFDDSFVDSGLASGNIASLLIGVILATPESIATARIVISYYKTIDGMQKKAIIRCMDSKVDNIFRNLTYFNATSLKKSVDNGIFQWLWEEEVNEHVKNLYERFTGLVASDDYNYDLEFTFNEERKNYINYSYMFVDDKGSIYEYFLMKSYEKVEIVRSEKSILGKRFYTNITNKMTYSSKLSPEMLKPFDIK